MARKKSSSVRREKKEMADNIRKRVISAQKALVDTSEEVTSSKEMATAVSSVAISIEALSEGQEKLFNALIEELSKIPETVEQKENKSEKVLEKLLDAILEMEKQLEKTTDPEQRAKIEQGISKLRGQADVAMEGTSRGRALKTPGDVISKFLGVDPRERKEAGGGVSGFLKAFVGQDKSSGLRGDVKKFFGIQPQRTVDEMLAAKRGSEDIAGTLTQAKEQKENERKAAIAARLKDVPEHFRVKSDETGRFRVGTKGNRIDEYTPTGALNPRFQPASGMMGKQLVDEGSGFTYEAGKGVQAGMVPGGAGASVPVRRTGVAAGTSLPAPAAGMMASGGTSLPASGGGTDAETDTFKDDLLKKLEDTNEQLEDIETATSKGLLGGLVSFLGPAMAGITAIGPALLPIGVALAGIWAGMKVFQAVKGFKEMREAQKEAKASEERGVVAEGNLVKTLEERDPQLLEAAKKLQAADKSPEAKDKPLAAYVGQARQQRQQATRGTPPAAAAASQAAASVAPAATAVTASMAPSAATSPAVTSTPTRAATGAALETSAPPAAAAAPVINNIDNSSRVNAPQAAAATGGASVSLRDTHNSFMRFQDRRMARVF